MAEDKDREEWRRFYKKHLFPGETVDELERRHHMERRVNRIVCTICIVFFVVGLVGQLFENIIPMPHLARPLIQAAIDSCIRIALVLILLYALVLVVYSYRHVVVSLRRYRHETISKRRAGFSILVLVPCLVIFGIPLAESVTGIAGDAASGPVTRYLSYRNDLYHGGRLSCHCWTMYMAGTDTPTSARVAPVKLVVFDPEVYDLLVAARDRRVTYYPRLGRVVDVGKLK